MTIIFCDFCGVEIGATYATQPTVVSYCNEACEEAAILAWVESGAGCDDETDDLVAFNDTQVRDESTGEIYTIEVIDEPTTED